MTPTQQNHDPSNPPSLTPEETGIVLVMSDGTIAACNRAAEQILGMTIKQLQDAASTNSPWQTVDANGTLFCNQLHPVKVALETKESCFNVEMGFHHPDGGLVWIKTDAQPLFQRGETNPYAVTLSLTRSLPPASARQSSRIVGTTPTQQSVQADKDRSPADCAVEEIAAINQPDDQRWRVLLQSLPVGVVLVDPITAAIVEFNDAAAVNLGYTRAEFARLPITAIDVRRNADTILQQLRTMTAQPEGITIETQHRTKSGDTRDVLIIGRRVEIDRRMFVYGIWIDTTERLQLRAERERAAAELAEINVQLEQRNYQLSTLNEELEVALEEVQVAEEELIQQNAELRSVQTELRNALQRLTFHVENSPLAVIEWDHNFQISRWSGEAERIFGWQAQEVIGRNFADWKFVHEADKAYVQARAETLTNGSTQRVILHNRNYTKSGEVVHCEWYNSALVDRDGRLVSILSLALDVSDRVRIQTELRESEARYRALAEAIPQLVWVTTAAGQNEYVNQQFCDFVGLTQAQLSNSNWLEIIHPEDRDRTRDRWFDCVASGDFYEIEYRFRRFDGTYRWFLGQGVPFRDEAGQVVKWFGTCTDIDAQKQMEADRLRLIAEEQAAREAAEQANRIKDEFLAVVSHELRTPLNPILGWSKLLKSGKLTPDRAAEALSTIERNAQQQAQLIDDLLDVSRILRNKLTLTVEPVDLTMIVTDALETVRLAAEAKSIDLQAALQSNLATVMGDTGRLQQIVWNLLSNAVKFTPDGGRIRVQLDQIDSQARLQVIDSGKGIAPQFLPHLFEAFRQEDNTTTRQFGGLGLGLSIVQQLVQLHGGTVTAESPGLGQGATFTVRLPIAPQHRIGTAAAIDPATINLSNVRILVVDDVQDSREFVAFVLEQAGAIVTTASSAASALEQLIEVDPDLMISDVGMPQMNGYELIRQIRRSFDQFQATPAIALSAYATEEDQQQALEAGFDRHLAKPITPAALLQSVAALVNASA